MQDHELEHQYPCEISLLFNCTRLGRACRNSIGEWKLEVNKEEGGMNNEDYKII